MLRLSNISIGIKLGVMSTIGVMLVLAMIACEQWLSGSLRDEVGLALDLATIAVLIGSAIIGVSTVARPKSPALPRFPRFRMV